MKASKIEHKGETRIKVDFPYNQEIKSMLKQIPDARWSASKGAWHIPYTKSAFDMLKELYPDIEYDKTKQTENILKRVVDKNISDSNYSLLSHFKEWMEYKRYSSNTINTYVDMVRTFLAFTKDKSVHAITSNDMQYFVANYVIARKLSYSFQNQVINACKLFFREIIKSSLDVETFQRPRPWHSLPNVLSKDEVKSILQVPMNPKHRMMLSLIYACGLRRSELLRLEPKHVDSKRGVLHIKQSKGKKDRIVPISERIIDMLREYYKIYKPAYWLFEGQQKGQPYSAESLQQVLKQALAKAKIRKPVTLHWLRHSYATHLLESGTDLRFIQELLGHNHSKTTEIYTHVSTKSIQKIKSPFDDL